MKPIRELIKQYGTQRKSSALQLKETLMAEAKQLIIDKGLTHQQAADKVGCSRQRITSLSSGQSELFSIEWLMDFLEKFGRKGVDGLALLIACAPEMYAMLESVLVTLADINAYDEVGRIEALLAKARGEK